MSVSMADALAHSPNSANLVALVSSVANRAACVGSAACRWRIGVPRRRNAVRRA